MSIGYACLVYGVKKYSLKSCTLKSIEKIPEIVEHNLDLLMEVLRYNVDNNIYLFRISSDIIPLGSHKENTFDWKEAFRDKLSSIGDFIEENNIRVSMHPGQYTVLNSNKDDVVEKAILDLKYHSDFLEALNLDCSNKIVLHIGGVYGDKISAKNRFIDNFKQLDDNIKSRLIIENDEKSYNIADVLDISSYIKVPVVFDNLHHRINPPKGDSLSDKEWILRASSTWKELDGRQKIHYSQQKIDGRVGSHSSTIHIDSFLDFYRQVRDLDIDIMLEVKDKNLSAIKCIIVVDDFRKNILESEWARYKYLVLYHSHNSYLEIRALFSKDNSNISLDFYRLVESSLSTKPTVGSIRNSLSHIWGYFKDKSTKSESKKYNSLLEKLNLDDFNPIIFKRFLYKLSVKYKVDYLLDSYFFYDI